MTRTKQRHVRWSAALVVLALVGFSCGVLSAQVKQITGAVLSASGEAIAGAAVSLVTADEADRAEVVRTQTSGSGEYVLPFSRSAGVLTVEASGYVGRHLPIRSGEPAGWSAIRLQPARSISGQVVGEPGDVPLAADILVLQASPDLNTRSIQAGKDGSFTVDGVDASDTTLIVRADGYAQQHVAITATAASAAGVVIRLSRLAVLTGKVVDVAGRPIAGAEVSLAVSRTRLPHVDLQTWVINDASVVGTAEISLAVTAAEFDDPDGCCIDGVNHCSFELCMQGLNDRLGIPCREPVGVSMISARMR